LPFPELQTERLRLRQFRGHGLWAAEEKASGALIGRIGLQCPDGWPGLEVAWLVARERWREGFATEGARAALGHAFAVLREPRAISLIAPGNAASIRVAEKLGMRLEETRRIAGKVASLYAIRRADPLPGQADVLSLRRGFGGGT
jgi:RimJ/RimL family protein N-acetyltransferase